MPMTCVQRKRVSLGAASGVETAVSSFGSAAKPSRVAVATLSGAALRATNFCPTRPAPINSSAMIATNIGIRSCLMPVFNQGASHIFASSRITKKLPNMAT